MHTDIPTRPDKQQIISGRNVITVLNGTLNKPLPFGIP